jgi:hypothetical protein
MLTRRHILTTAAGVLALATCPPGPTNPPPVAVADHVAMLDRYFDNVVVRLQFPLKPGESPHSNPFGPQPCPGHRFETDAELVTRARARALRPDEAVVTA